MKICIFPKSRAGEIAEKQHSFESRAGEIAKQAAPVNGQDERFAPLTAAARRAFWQTRRAGTDCACPPIHILAIVDIGFSTGVVAGCALFQGVPDAVACYLSSYGGGAGEFA